MPDRVARINELMLRELSSLLRRHFREETMYITITRIAIAPDLQQGQVFFSTPDESSREAAQKFLERHRGEIKNLLVRRVTLKHFPELNFCFDPKLEKELRVNKILDSLESEPEKLL
jgi:ribosome-binding factor A